MSHGQQWFVLIVGGLVVVLLTLAFIANYLSDNNNETK